MAIEFGTPQSMYVDPRSVEIGNTLRERYASNFQAADQLEAQLSTLNVADFAGDQQMKKMLMDSTRSRLEQLADRGDYENLSLPVAKTARNFQKQYQPLEDNYNRYQQYVSDVTKQYQDGDIDSETYKTAVAASKHGYTGIQVDTDGNVDPDSYFSGITLVNDVDIPALLEERIKGIVAEQEGQMVQEVGQGPNGMYAVTQSGEVIAVTEQRVREIYEGVISQPDVQAALAQKATLRTYNMEGQDLSNTVNSDIEMYKGELAKGQEILATGGLSAQEAVQLQQQMSQVEQEMNTLSNYTDAQKQSYVKRREMAGILKPIESAFLAKNVYSKRPASSNYQKINYDDWWMARQKSALVEGRDIRKEQRANAREDAKNAEKEAMSAIGFNAPGNITAELEADPRNIIANMSASLQMMENYNTRASTEDLSGDALLENKQAQIRTSMQYDMEQARLVGAAIAAGILTEDDLTADGKPSDFDWYTLLDNSQLDAIEDVFKDDSEDNPYYWQQPKNLVLQSSDGELFKQFEESLKAAWPTLPKGTPVMVLDGDEFVDGTTDDFVVDGKTKQIKDVSIARQPITGQAGSNVVAVTFQDGTMALVKQDVLKSPYLDKISSQPAYKLNSMAQGILDIPMYDFNTPYPLNTTYTDSKDVEHNVTINIFPGDNLDDTRFQIIRPEDQFTSQKLTPNELKDSLDETDLKNIVL